MESKIEIAINAAAQIVKKYIDRGFGFVHDCDHDIRYVLRKLGLNVPDCVLYDIADSVVKVLYLAGCDAKWIKPVAFLGKKGVKYKIDGNCVREVKNV